jgi:hypothetical protein
MVDAAATQLLLLLLTWLLPCGLAQVGLLYIADAQHDPRAHVAALEQLHRGVLEQLGKDLPTAVFQLHQRGGITGELLVQQGQGEGGQQGRLLLFEEYLAGIREQLRQV